MSKLLKILVLCVAILTPSTTVADTPEFVRDNYPLVTAGGCEDQVSGEQGVCFIFATSGGFYLVFVQDGKPVFMRYIVPPNPYVEVWRAPRGVAL